LRHFPKLLALLLTCASIALSQTGFTTKTYSVPGGSVMRVADFNKDGKPDLLIYSATTAYVLLNNGSGGFGGPINLPAGSQFAYAQIGDLNKDGNPDIAACTYNSQTSAYALSTYFNDGAGHFTLRQTLPLTGNCTSVNLWDIDQNGNLDVVTTTATYSGTPGSYVNQTQVWFDAGGGNLSNAPVVQTYNLDDPNGQNNGEFGCSLNQAVLADFYKNTAHPGIMLFADCYGSQGPINYGTVWIAQSSGDGHFGALTEIQGGGTGYGDASYPKALDINLDGKPDVLTQSAQYGPHGSYNSYTYFVQNNGAPNFTWNGVQSESAYAGSGGFNEAATGGVDFNGDGFGDIAIAFQETRSDFSGNDQFIAILNGSANGQFAESQRWDLGDSLSFGVTDLATADFNNDGRPDLAALVYNQNTGATTLYVYLNTQGNVSCAPPSSPGVHVCAPQSGGTYASPVQFTAAGTGASGSVQRMELWIDGKKISDYFSSVVNTHVSLSNGQHSATFVEVDSTGAYIKSSPVSFTVGSGAGGGGCLPSGPGAKICAPANGATVSSPVTISAGATASSGNITAIRVYVDNASVLTVNNPSATNSFSINQSISISNGNHSVVIVGYQSNGGAQTTSENITVGSGGSGPCTPSGPGAKICSPANGATVNSPVQLSAGATASTGYITALRVYVDNVAVATVNDPSQNATFSINQSIAMSAGKHYVVVVGYQSNGQAQSASENITVQ